MAELGQELGFFAFVSLALLAGNYAVYGTSMAASCDWTAASVSWLLLARRLMAAQYREVRCAYPECVPPLASFAWTALAAVVASTASFLARRLLDQGHGVLRLLRLFAVPLALWQASSYTLATAEARALSGPKDDLDELRGYEKLCVLRLVAVLGTSLECAYITCLLPALFAAPDWYVDWHRCVGFAVSVAASCAALLVSFVNTDRLVRLHRGVGYWRPAPTRPLQPVKEWKRRKVYVPGSLASYEGVAWEAMGSGTIVAEPKSWAAEWMQRLVGHNPILLLDSAVGAQVGATVFHSLVAWTHRHPLADSCLALASCCIVAHLIRTRASARERTQERHSE